FSIKRTTASLSIRSWPCCRCSTVTLIWWFGRRPPDEDLSRSWNRGPTALCSASELQKTTQGREQCRDRDGRERGIAWISYSVRNASRGLRRAPRRAGSQHTSSATVNNSTVE